MGVLWVRIKTGNRKQATINIDQITLIIDSTNITKLNIFQVFEVISWASSGTGYKWYWIVFDMLNVLRALAVFIIFVCKRDIIFALEENYPCLKRRVTKVLLIFGLCYVSAIVLIVSTMHFTYHYNNNEDLLEDSSDNHDI